MQNKNRLRKKYFFIRKKRYFDISPTFFNPLIKLINKKYKKKFLSEVKKWQNLPLKPNEEKVLSAVLTLMENIDQIDIFNKKAIYLYLREITGLNTKQIVSCLNKMRIKYRNFKKKWDQGEIY